MFIKAGGAESLISFSQTTSDSGERTYCSPWDTDVYRAYSAVGAQGHLVLVYFNSDGNTLSRSGTQSITLHRVRFSNIDQYSEDWHTVAIAPSHKLIPSSLQADKVRKPRLQLMHRFIFTAFKNLISASYTGLAVNGVLLFPRISMVITDQSEERALLSLKGRDSYMDCTHWCLPSRLPKTGSNTNPGTTSSDDDGNGAKNGHTSTRNVAAQLDSSQHPPRDPVDTVRSQLHIAKQNVSQCPPSGRVLHCDGN